MASQDPISIDERESESEDSYFNPTPAYERAPSKGAFDDTSSESEAEQSELDDSESESEGPGAGESTTEQFEVDKSEPEKSDAEKSKPEKSDAEKSDAKLKSAFAVKSRKRKRAKSKSNHQARKYRLTGQYVDEYRLLFNEDVKDACDRFSVAPSRNDDLNSQVGSSVWTAKEKNVFFSALTRLGKDALPEIAAAIVTKSEVQVREYMLLLQDGLREHVLHDRRLFLSSYSDHDAAIELGEECCKSLDRAGEALAWLQDKFDARVEKKKHGDHWLLDRELAERLEGAKAADSEQPTPTSEIEGEIPDEPTDHTALLPSVPANDLLNLPRWLTLSERLFMNSKSDHWEIIADPHETPSLYHTAFQDFHQLAISITRRLIHTTIFEASSRIRSENFRVSRNPEARVRIWDVHAAIDVLGMKRNSKEYWTKLPRRLDLDVYERLPKLDSKRKPATENSVLSHDYVEHQLGLPRQSKSPASPDHGPHEATPPEDVSEPSDTDNPDTPEDTAHTPSDLHADHTDAVRSRAEELKLWDMLQYSPPASLLNPLPDPPPKHNARPTLDDIADWRDDTTYTPSWTTHGSMSRDAQAQPQSPADAGTNEVTYLPKRFRTPPPDEPAPAPAPATATRPSKSTRTPAGPKIRKNKPAQTARAKGTKKLTATEKAAAKARAIEGTQELWDDSEGDVPEGGLVAGPSQPRVLPSRNAREEARERVSGVEYAPWDREGDSEAEWRMEE